MAKIPKCVFIILIFLLISFMTLSLLTNENCNQESCRDHPHAEPISNPYLENELRQGPISIASVICSKNGDNSSREEAAVMIKSVIISAILYQLETAIEFHLFLEHTADQEYFRSELKKYGYAQVSLHFYSAIDAVPKKYQQSLIADKRFRCMYDRIFFPKILSDLDAVLYLDIDIIVAGNVMDLWTYFSLMDDQQLVGVVQDIDSKSPKRSPFVNDIPYPKPKGMNSGLQLMNLTRMREYGWEEKIMRLYEDYGKRGRIRMNDQKLLNILLYFDSGIWMQLPCQFNYWFTNCLDGLYCDGASQDPKGIQVIHGAANGFNNGRAFREIFLDYHEFQLNNQTSISDIKQQLMIPIRSKYAKGGKRKKYPHHKKCDGTIDKLIFKQHFSK